jgi:hypothetical protein
MTDAAQQGPTDRVEKDRLRHWRASPFLDPAGVLRHLRVLENQLADADPKLKEKVRRLRTNELKKERESRDAALFTYLAGTAQGVQMRYLPEEAADYDFVVTWHTEQLQHFCLVQLKELVPVDLNANASLDDLLNGLPKHGRSTRAILAIKLNRRGFIDLSALTLPRIPFKELWFFWAASPDGDTWCLYGDALKRPRQATLPYPT